MEFHVSRQARDRYKLDVSLFSFNGNVIFANFHAVRTFAQKINQQRDLLSYPEKAVKAGEINAMGLIDEVLHLVLEMYRQQKNPRVMHEALTYLERQLGSPAVAKLLTSFTTEFPPTAVYRGELTANEYLDSLTNGESNRVNTLEEILMLWISNKNPALSNYQELFDDQTLQTETIYTQSIQTLYHFFETQPKFGPDNQNLIDVLRAPALAHPHSLFDQLDFIRQRWVEIIGRYLYRLLSSLDFIREETKTSFAGPGPIPIPVYDRVKIVEEETENFSPDREWMPRLVLMAKNTYVWLDQLSQKYQRGIHYLNEIPDEELEELARSGFTGLWLIGLWERSKASARIKQLCGNQEAIASAYSLSDYRIADDLGGEQAYNDLRDRAWKYGIRMASDMVPNHMGIDSSWVVEHPDWFISLDYSPFPSYTFNGPDLSADHRIGIFLEDHYFSRTDAAVVFKRVDYASGQTKFVYHGNDGTTMPWNDTAQLNYLNPEVREAVIQTILNVARRSPIIRFDAAMTLAKKHFHRLWYPEPGTGGAIPSRAEQGLTKDQFDQLVPVEFWREVVDRVAKEVPDTLLLAEAFWLMEGYFVRTLGMHRVYNSAFMNMLRNEENNKYRTLIKNTLEFEPEILKRYVNFMNNPDEKTAVEQFGKGDKYFGICILMSTLPGLPMFGHGQVEGYSEKYGMEFKRAYWDEKPDPYLVERHKREIFPVLHKRALFAGVENFLFYDFFTEGGWVNEDVYAYSNGLGGERALVVYHNKFGNTRGWLKWSVGFTRRSDQKKIIQESLANGLQIHGGENTYTIFRDSVSGQEFIHSSQEIQNRGLFLDLGAYKSYVFMDFREVTDDEYGSYKRLTEYLNGRGVPSIEEAIRELFLQPIQQPFSQIANPGYLNFLLSNRITQQANQLPEGLLDEAVEKFNLLPRGIEILTGTILNPDQVATRLRNKLELALTFGNLQNALKVPASGQAAEAIQYLQAGFDKDPARWIALFSSLFIQDLGLLKQEKNYESLSVSWLDEWRLTDPVIESARQLGIKEEHLNRLYFTLRLLISQQNWFDTLGTKTDQRILEAWLSEPEIVRFLGINRYNDILWFNQEAFEEFIWWMLVCALLQTAGSPQGSTAQLMENLVSSYQIAQKMLSALTLSEYQIAKLITALI